MFSKQMWPAQWYTPVIPELGRMTQEDYVFDANLAYIPKCCLKKQTNQIYVLVVLVELHKFMEITEVQIYNCPMV